MDFEKLLYGLALYDDNEIHKNEIYRKHIAYVFDYFLDVTNNPIKIEEALKLDIDILKQLEDLVFDLSDIETLNDNSKKLYDIYKAIRDVDYAQMDFQNLQTNFSCTNKIAKYKLF